MRQLDSNPRVDNSDPSNYPHGRIRDNDGSGNGTDVNERVYGDIHSMKEQLMILAGIVANNLPDNTANGYQLIDALIALASKNDYIQDLTTTAGVLQIPVKVALMKTGESLICKAAADKTSETTIKGSDNSVTAVTFSGNFKANEYVRFIKTGAGVTLVRIGDNVSLNAMVTDLLFLKKANYAQELAGSIDTVATTPQTNALVFVERVNGASSAASLATALRNGLYPKEHFAIVAGLVGVRNTGWFSGLDVGGTGSLPVFGYTSAVATAGFPGDDESFVLVTMPVAMDDLNYRVECYVQSEGTIGFDNEISGIVFRPVSTTTFTVTLRGLNVAAQSLKIHMDVRQLQ